MLRFGMIGMMFVISACSADKPSSESKTGWSSSKDIYRISLFYNFQDDSGVRFTATCDRFPIFVLSGGNYVGSTGKFRLYIDNHSWNFDIWAGEHGRALIIDDPHFAEHFAQARRRIAFRVDAWERSFKPTPELARFVAACRSMRKADPDADGIPVLAPSPRPPGAGAHPG